MKQYQLSPFLDAYDTIVFDLDGVITSEQMYWNSAALTVYELCYGSHYFGNQDLSAEMLFDNTQKIRQEVFCDDKTISCLKSIGINSNWDLAYVVSGLALTLTNTVDFHAVLTFAKQFKGDIFKLYQEVTSRLCERFHKEADYFKRAGEFWQTHIMLPFQEWFMGDELFEKNYGLRPRLCGKRGFLDQEEPLFNKEKLLLLFRLLSESGKRIGIGTGRPAAESKPVLSRWGLSDWIATDAFITYDDVLSGQKELLSNGMELDLPKPHPFMFVKAVFGDSVQVKEIVSGDYDKKKTARALAVGDAASDLYAAKSAGMAFLSVLTGIQGKNARAFFEEEKADYILDCVLDLLMEKDA